MEPCAAGARAGLDYGLGFPLFIITRLFGYGSTYGEWGVPRVLRSLADSFDAFQALNSAYARYGKWLLLAVIAGQSLWMNRCIRKPSLFLQCGLVIFTFMAMTPGFGVQYLAWLVPWASVAIAMQLIYYSASGLFLFLIYTAWSGGLPWYFAESFVLKDRLMYLEILCWISVVIVLIMYHKAVLGHSAIYGKHHAVG